MRRMLMGLFGLVILLGNQLGSMLGVAIAICVFMILDGLAEAVVIQKLKNKRQKEWVNYAARTSNRNSNNSTGNQRGESERLKKDESTKEEA